VYVYSANCWNDCVLLGNSGEGYYANQEDDFIFEDFARLRLKGYSVDETEA